MDKVTIGETIKKERLSKNLTLQQLAIKAGINRYQTVMRIEAGEEDYKIDTFLSLLEALNLSLVFSEDNELIFDFKNVKSE
jgi:transcriptional regulator with XRE-family HTH domain